jgi:hypothetical protein
MKTRLMERSEHKSLSEFILDIYLNKFTLR